MHEYNQVIKKHEKKTRRQIQQRKAFPDTQRQNKVLASTDFYNKISLLTKVHQTPQSLNNTSPFTQEKPSFQFSQISFSPKQKYLELNKSSLLQENLLNQVQLSIPAVTETFGPVPSGQSPAKESEHSPLIRPEISSRKRKRIPLQNLVPRAKQSDERRKKSTALLRVESS